MGQDPRGGWITVKYESSSPTERLDGELLAIDSLHAWVAVDSVVRVADLEPTTKLRLDAYDPHVSAVVGAALAGSLLTFTNGWYLVFTAPGWWLTGMGAAGSRSEDPIVAGHADEWRQFVPYARFPQGIPATMAAGGASVSAPPALRLPPPPERFPPPERKPSPPAIVRKYWFTAGAGPGFEADYSGIGFVSGLGIGLHALTLASRLAMVPHDSQTPVEDTHETFDLAFLIGLQSQGENVQAAVAAGPAAWSTSFADLVDFNWSFAAQAQVIRYLDSGIGVGVILAYNDHEFGQSFMFALAIAYGSR